MKNINYTDIERRLEDEIGLPLPRTFADIKKYFASKSAPKRFLQILLGNEESEALLKIMNARRLATTWLSILNRDKGFTCADWPGADPSDLLRARLLIQRFLFSPKERAVYPKAMPKKGERPYMVSHRAKLKKGKLYYDMPKMELF